MRCGLRNKEVGRRNWFVDRGEGGGGRNNISHREPQGSTGQNKATSIPELPSTPAPAMVTRYWEILGEVLGKGE